MRITRWRTSPRERPYTKILLDHNIPDGLRDHFPEGHEVYIASYLGWSGYGDSEILSKAVEEGFEVFITLNSDLTEHWSFASGEST